MTPLPAITPAGTSGAAKAGTSGLAAVSSPATQIQGQGNTGRFAGLLPPLKPPTIDAALPDTEPNAPDGWQLTDLAAVEGHPQAGGLLGDNRIVTSLVAETLPGGFTAARSREETPVPWQRRTDGQPGVEQAPSSHEPARRPMVEAAREQLNQATGDLVERAAQPLRSDAGPDGIAIPEELAAVEEPLSEEAARAVAAVVDDPQSEASRARLRPNVPTEASSSTSPGPLTHPTPAPPTEARAPAAVPDLDLAMSVEDTPESFAQRLPDNLTLRLDGVDDGPVLVTVGRELDAVHVELLANDRLAAELRRGEEELRASLAEAGFELEHFDARSDQEPGRESPHDEHGVPRPSPGRRPRAARTSLLDVYA